MSDESSTAENSYVAALHAKLPVNLYDPSQSVLSAGTKRFASWLDKDVAKGRLSQGDADDARDRLLAVKGDGTQGDAIKDDTSLVVEVSGREAGSAHGRLYLRFLI